LLEYKLAGGEVETVASAYESFLGKVHLPSFGMANVLRAETQRANRRVMALQAIYSNPIGLFLFLVLWPVLLLVGLISRQAAGGSGTLFERVECAGFQGIPFRRRQFRLRHAVTGKKTLPGKWIERLGITNLPQIINLNRGEMALFGPQPMRMVFSEYLEEVSPQHLHRLSIKPGIFGWEQTHITSEQLPEEHVRMSYEFYYIERGSPVMDIQILLRSLWVFRRGLWAGY
jgi:lipopolysaccharide/colanic/teichoic acid biosynthesis glycosyltransferase